VIRQGAGRDAIGLRAVATDFCLLQKRPHSAGNPASYSVHSWRYFRAVRAADAWNCLIAFI